MYTVLRCDHAFLAFAWMAALAGVPALINAQTLIANFESGSFPVPVAPPTVQALPDVPSGQPLLVWYSAGWSGQFGNGLNKFEVLNAAQTSVLTTIPAPMTKSWQRQSVDLAAIGLGAGDQFYFRAIGGSSAKSYSWLAIDNMQFAPASSNITSTWNGASANWTSNNWSTPFFPNNANGGLAYDAVINGGTVTLDQSIAIQSLSQSGGIIAGPSNLTLNGASIWTSDRF